MYDVSPKGSPKGRRTEDVTSICTHRHDGAKLDHQAMVRRYATLRNVRNERPRPDKRFSVLSFVSRALSAETAPTVEENVLEIRPHRS